MEFANNSFTRTTNSFRINYWPQWPTTLHKQWNMFIQFFFLASCMWLMPSCYRKSSLMDFHLSFLQLCTLVALLSLDLCDFCYVEKHMKRRANNRNKWIKDTDDREQEDKKSMWTNKQTMLSARELIIQNELIFHVVFRFSLPPFLMFKNNAHRIIAIKSIFAMLWIE